MSLIQPLLEKKEKKKKKKKRKKKKKERKNKKEKRKKKRILGQGCISITSPIPLGYI